MTPVSWLRVLAVLRIYSSCVILGWRIFVGQQHALLVVSRESLHERVAFVGPSYTPE